ncbi:MAG: ATP-binding cassette domain-containing protein [Lentisphaeraceae bacterium]|nr:ATP-binding cassette domain-containing protein [Lentisphaeraceae bacterium]
MNIHLKNISHSYDERQLFNKLNWQFEENNYYLLKGDSGSGKSTLLKIISQLINSDEGEIFIPDHEQDSILSQRRKVQYLPQLPVMFPGSVEENLLKPFSFKPYMNQQPSKKKLSKALIRLFPEGIDLDKDAQKLSQGQKQRVALCRTLLLEPHILLVDEPAASLDDNSRRLVDEAIWQFYKTEKNRMVIYISHHSNILAGENFTHLLVQDGVLQEL